MFTFQLLLLLLLYLLIVYVSQTQQLLDSQLSQPRLVETATATNNQEFTTLTAKEAHYEHHGPATAPHRHHNMLRNLPHQKNNNNNKKQRHTPFYNSSRLQAAPPPRTRKKPNGGGGGGSDDLLITTQSGRVRGRSYYLDHHIPRHSKSRHKKYRVNAWLGIPFAEKPVKDLRFKRPVPVQNWDDVLNATELPNTCYQIPDSVIPDFPGVEMWNPNTNMSEDCLYLNIWTPHPKPRNSPVMVWIYGGGFVTGTSTLKVYDPKVIVAETQLIFVSIQYRLSIFGFLYMDHENAPGNQGLLDQYLALKWIHNNIQYFGGDSSRITIFGESAGSVSVSLHLLSTLSASLFRNAVLESATSLADWSMLKNLDAIKRYTGILRSFDCNGSTHDMIECAKRMEPKLALERADEHFYTHATHGIAQYTFLPVVDSYFLEEEPINLLNRGKFKKCPLLIGANKDEGNWFFVYAFPEYRNMSAAPVIDYDSFKDFVTSLFHFYPQYPMKSSDSVLNAIVYRYTHWNNVHNQQHNYENLDEAAGDFHFLCPVVDFANIYALNGMDVYFYYFTQRSSQHHWPQWLGVMHGDEIPFVFGEPIYPEYNYTQAEKVLSRKMLKYWSNFVLYEDPNGAPPPATSALVTTVGAGAADQRSSDHTASKHHTILSSIIANTIATQQSNQRHYAQVHKLNSSSSATAAAAAGEKTLVTQTMLQPIETWPKYQIYADANADTQRAYLVFNSEKVYVDYNLRAEYCTFWGSYLPKLILSESRCQYGACTKQLDMTGLNGAMSVRLSSVLVYAVLLFCWQFVRLSF